MLYAWLAVLEAKKKKKNAVKKLRNLFSCVFITCRSYEVAATFHISSFSFTCKLLIAIDSSIYFPVEFSGHSC